jgi:antirestriction protein ArdC
MSNHPSVYETVTQSIIEELKHNLVPWIRPWKSAASTFPHNVVSQRPYSGVNILLLWATAAEREYANPAWLTFKQAAALGGTVKKGEKATAIVYADTVKKREANDSGEEVEKSMSFLKFYNVFNLDQTCGLPNHLYAIPEQKPIGARLFHVEVFLRRIAAEIRHGGDKAYYSPAEDFIVLPRMEDFESTAHYYATSLHEHVHHSGHPTRLNRDLGGRFGTRSYAAEELVAEMGVAFLCSFLQINAELRHASYIASWLELLENDSRAIFTAASLATKAADYLRSFSA